MHEDEKNKKQFMDTKILFCSSGMINKVITMSQHERGFYVMIIFFTTIIKYFTHFLYFKIIHKKKASWIIQQWVGYFFFLFTYFSIILTTFTLNLRKLHSSITLRLYGEMTHLIIHIMIFAFINVRCLHVHAHT